MAGVNEKSQHPEVFISETFSHIEDDIGFRYSLPAMETVSCYTEGMR